MIKGNTLPVPHKRQYPCALKSDHFKSKQGDRGSSAGIIFTLVAATFRLRKIKQLTLIL